MTPRPTVCAGRSRGFTLIELLIVFALIGVLITLAAPSYIQYQRNARLRAVSSSLISSISAARAEALKQQKFTFVVPKQNGDWNTGWDTFVDMDSDLKLSAGDKKIGDQSETPSSIGVTVTSTLSAANNYVMFGGSGFPRLTKGGFRGGSFTLQVDGSTDVKRRIIMFRTGRVRVCDPDKDSDCKDATE